MKFRFTHLVLFFALLGLASLACGISLDSNQPVPEVVTVVVVATQPPQQPTPIPPTSIPPTPIPPTVAPQPTAAEVVAQEPAPQAPQVPETYQQTVDYYYEKGYLPSTTGEYIPLDDFSKDWAMINYYYTEETGQFVENFMVTAHFDWQSAIRYPDPSGCGWAFHMQGEDEYLFFVDREYVWMMTWDDSRQQPTRIGTTTGSPWVGMGNPADTDVVLVVNGTKAYVLVDDQFKGSYTLDTDWLIGKGAFAYAVVSGTNADYGTRCRITDAALWVIDD